MLTRAILAEGVKAVAAGMNPMDLRRGINIAVDSVVATLKTRTKRISTTEEISQVCRHKVEKLMKTIHIGVVPLC